MLGLDNKLYLKNKGLMKEFLETDFLKEKVLCDYNAKIKDNPNYTILNSLFLWINKNIKYSENETYRAENKFQRSAKEIWESGLATGCTDYAIVFATLARQLEIPTTILHTMTDQFVLDIQQGKSPRHIGHTFCECFYDNKWVLVDPANCKFISKYNENKIELNYEINKEKIFIPCERNINFKKQTIKEFNFKMDILSKDIKEIM